MDGHRKNERIRIELLGGFRAIVAGRSADQGEWPGRRAAELVQLLALSEGHRLTRDRVIECLWPHLRSESGAANVRKAAHHARKALGSPDAVVLRGGWVSLFPSRSVETDVEEFERAAGAASRTADPAAAAAAYGGDLLPESLYEEWTQERRRELQAQHARLLHESGQWERLVEADPTDERAYRELMRGALDAGNRPAAVRWYSRLRATLAQELAVAPSGETRAVYDECLEGSLAGDPAFVNRQVELAEARAMLRITEGGAAGALVIRGPPGIGKSALCRELKTLAGSEDWLVTMVTATEGGPPYAPLAAAVEQLVVLDRTAIATVPEQPRAVLAALTPLAGPAQPVDGGLTRHKVIGAVERLLAGYQGATGVLLCVDDAHLADEATVEALLHIAVGRDAPALIVLAYRAELAGATMSRGVSRLRRCGRLSEIDLGPLDSDDSAALVAAAAAAPPDAGTVARIGTLAEGNPFFILELARRVGAEASPAVGPTLSDVIAQRFVDLDEGTAEMLTRLAVAGEDFDPVSVVAVSGLAEPHAFAALDTALEEGVLIVSDAGYAFRHALVRQALVDRVPPHRRIVIHRAAARRLAAAGGEPARIARHWLDGGSPAEAVDWLLAAARQAVELGAFADALGHLECLLEHVPEHADALCLRAEALDALGDSGALAAFAMAARVVGEPGSREIRPRQAIAQLKAGDPVGALSTLEGVEPTSPAGRLCLALTRSGAAAIGFGDPDLAAIKADEARLLADELGDSGAIVDASWAQSLAAHARGDLQGSLRAALYATHDMPALAIRVFDGHLCATERLLYGAFPYSEVIAFADSLASEAERLGARRGYAFALTLRGEARLLSGELDQADDDLAAGAREHRLIAAPAGEAIALQRRADAALYRGRPSDALMLARRALALARDSNLGHHLLDRIYGTMIAAAPDSTAALVAVEEAETAVRGPLETCPACKITLAVPAAIAAASAGERDQAESYAQTAQMLADVVLQQRGWHAAVDEVKGHLACARGELEAADGLFRRAAAGFRDSGQPLDTDRCVTLAENAS